MSLLVAALGLFLIALAMDNEQGGGPRGLSFFLGSLGALILFRALGVL